MSAGHCVGSLHCLALFNFYFRSRFCQPGTSLPVSKHLWHQEREGFCPVEWPCSVNSAVSDGLQGQTPCALPPGYRGCPPRFAVIWRGNMKLEESLILEEVCTILHYTGYLVKSKWKNEQFIITANEKETFTAFLPKRMLSDHSAVQWFSWPVFSPF